MPDTEGDYKPTAIEAETIDWAAAGLKLDPHGFPLHPQPSSDPRGETQV